jgi:hypothetical protein
MKFLFPSFLRFLTKVNIQNWPSFASLSIDLRIKNKKVDTIGIDFVIIKIGSGGGIRTPDQAVNSRLLYH